MNSSNIVSKLGDGYGDYGDPGTIKDPAAVIPSGDTPASDYVNAFSPDGTHTSLDKGFENTQLANVQKSDPNYSIQSGYAVPAATPSVWPKVVGFGVIGFGIYWFFIRKKA